jgi:hypothetical protein
LGVVYRWSGHWNSWRKCVLVTVMDDLRTFVDGRRFLTGSPFRSVYFVVASALGFVAVTVDVYVIYRHRQTLNIYVALVLGILIGVQIIYQWWRTLRYYSKLRKLYAMRSEEEAKVGTPLDIALRITAGGLTDILFYCYGMTLASLVLIGVLLTHLA